MPSQIRHDEAITRREKWNDRGPEFVMNRKGMQQNDGRSVAGDVKENIRSIASDSFHPRRLYARSKFWRVARSVPEVEHFDEIFPLIKLVVDDDRAVHQLTNLRALMHRSADARPTAEQFDVIKQGVAETGGRFGVISCNVSDYFREVG